MTTAQAGQGGVVRLTGRLDGESARHLSDMIEEMLREGARAIELDMSGIEYLSSAAIRVLSQKSADLTTLRGSLQVISPSPAAQETLDAAGLSGSVVRESAPPTAPARSRKITQWGLPAINAQHGSYEISRHGDGGVHVRLYGGGQSPLTAPLPDRYRSTSFPPRGFGIGIGAIASRIEDATPRLGELIAAEGTVAYQPSEGVRTPDYMFTYSDRAPQAVLASGIAWNGLFTDLMRFSAQPDSDEVPLQEMADVCVEMSGSQTVAIAVVAEMHAILGASLRRSPALFERASAAEADLSHIRDWLSFTPEPAYQGSTALIVGVVAKRPEEPLAAYLRPFGTDGVLYGHLHAAVFPYMPVPQRTVMLPALISRLFTESAPRDILHLIYDDRGAAAAGQTGLLRGVCWMAQITSLEEVR